MTIADYKNLFIPGYGALSEESQLAFEKTAPGLQFIAAVTKYQDDQNRMNFIDYYFLPLFFNYEKDFIKKNIDSIKDTNEYQEILSKITISILLPRFPILKHLSDESQEELANASYSEPIASAYNASTENQENIYNEWYEAFSNTFLTQTKLDEIAANQAKERNKILSAKANKLVQFFPLLNYSSEDTTPTVLSQLHTLYNTIPPTTPIETILKLETEILSNFLRNYLNAACNSDPYFKNFNLSDFNTNQAALLANKIITAFNQGSPLMTDQWLVEYGATLPDYFLSINGTRRALNQQEANDLSAALIDKFWKNKVVNGTWDLLNSLSESHAFLTNMGFSSQNDNIVNTLLELYNTHRIKEEVHEAKAIFAALFTPLRPFFEEYRDIRLHEKNLLIIFIRTIIPIIIIIGFVIGVSVLLGPLALPEVVLAFLIIPILFAAIVSSSAYIAVKNWTYNFCRAQWHGGEFETPEFKVNKRMISAFQSQETATNIREFYINELIQCNVIEENFLKIANDNSLTSEEMDTRVANMTRRCNLYMEWDYIHSNARIGSEKARTIALNRLNEDINKISLLMEKVWDKEDLPIIKASINTMITNMQAIFKAPSMDKKPDNSDEFKPTSIAKHNLSSQSLFKQQFKMHKDKACALDSIAKSIPT